MAERRIIYAGIDEAGYGPLLGPLCVASSVVEVRAAADAPTRPDLWAMLAPVVVREVADAATSSVVINDSKRVKLPSGGKRHPLEHLERGVLGVLACAGTRCGCDASLRSALGAGEAVGRAPAWYHPDAIALPLATTADQFTLICSRLSAACGRAGVRFAGVACRVCDETVFNAEVSRGALKSDISFERVAVLLRRVWEDHAHEPDLDEHGPRVVIDRQGGRVAYADRLAAAIPGVRVTTVMERREVSVYDLAGEGAGERRRMRVTFAIDADGSHFPVALASMTAKLVRELTMMRFNRYWCDRIAELKPTAGYGSDAKRWLREVEGHVSGAERAALRRMA